MLSSSSELQALCTRPDHTHTLAGCELALGTVVIILRPQTACIALEDYQGLVRPGCLLSTPVVPPPRCLLAFPGTPGKGVVKYLLGSLGIRLLQTTESCFQLTLGPCYLMQQTLVVGKGPFLLHPLS